MTDSIEANGIDLHLAYDPALKSKIQALFGKTASDIIAAIGGIIPEKGLKSPELNIRASSWFLNLYPKGNNLDILMGDKRYAIYSTTEEQSWTNTSKRAGFSAAYD